MRAEEKHIFFVLFLKIWSSEDVLFPFLSSSSASWSDLSFALWLPYVNMSAVKKRKSVIIWNNKEECVNSCNRRQAGHERCERRNRGSEFFLVSLMSIVFVECSQKSCFYLLMPEITAVPRCQPQLCILPGRKSGCTCHYREVTQEVNQASVSVPWLIVISGPQEHVTSVSSFKRSYYFVTRHISQSFHQQQGCTSRADYRGTGEKTQTSREKPGLSPCCLFILLFLQDLFPLSKVRGATKECVSSEQGKTKTRPARTVSTGPQFIWFSGLRSPALLDL